MQNGRYKFDCNAAIGRLPIVFAPAKAFISPLSVAVKKAAPLLNSEKQPFIPSLFLHQLAAFLVIGLHFFLRYHIAAGSPDQVHRIFQ